jgi:hypothetical protein
MDNNGLVFVDIALLEVSHQAYLTLSFFRKVNTMDTQLGLSYGHVQQRKAVLLHNDIRKLSFP